MVQGAGQIGMSNQALQPKPKPAPEIPVVCSTLNEKVDILRKELSILEQRLCVIMRPQAPVAATNGPSTYGAGFATQLGQGLAQAIGGLDNEINRVRGMLDLLEL